MNKQKDKLSCLQAIAKACSENPLETTLVIVGVYLMMNMSSCHSEVSALVGPSHFLTKVYQNGGR